MNFNWDKFFEDEFWVYFKNIEEWDNFKTYLPEDCSINYNGESEFIKGMIINNKKIVYYVSNSEYEYNVSHEIVDWNNYMSASARQEIEEKINNEKERIEKEKENRKTGKDIIIEEQFKKLYGRIHTNRKDILLIQEQIRDEVIQMLYEKGVIIIQIQKNAYLCAYCLKTVALELDRFKHLKAQINYKYETPCWSRSLNEWTF